MVPSSARRWPASPYKGLGFYTEDDTPLFAGRDMDVIRCAQTLAEWKTRILLLHGSTGCGKSSFLRAGLIPHLESIGSGISFARLGPIDQTPALFIRSTAEPLAKLASAAYNFAAREITLSAPDGKHKLNLRAALPDPKEHDSAAFMRAYADKPDILVNILAGLSRLVPETLVLVIDQAEEVLSMAGTYNGKDRRAHFFEFLSEFTDVQSDIKLLIALRTEYLGRFVSRLRRGLGDPRIVEYFLDELNDDKIKEAVLRPTSPTPVGMLGAPLNFYRFSFNEGVVDNIVQQLGRVAGGKLTAIQIVCGALYELVSYRKEPRDVTFQDLDSIGGVEGSIERFLDKQLVECGKAVKLAPIAYEEEIVRWKKALHKLALLQPDGTITTDIKRESALREELEGSRLDFDVTTNRLLTARVLREVDVADAATGNLIRCYGLGHDTLGLVLRNWKVRNDRTVADAPVYGSSVDTHDETPFAEKGTALCLSGGGYRSMLFHVGVLWRLYEADYLRRINYFSSVSASSITAGVLGLAWKRLSLVPSRVQQDFVPEVVDRIRQLAEKTIDTHSIMAGMIRGGASKQVAAAYDKHLFHGATLQDLPDQPRFSINATSLQSGALWRFGKAYMGDYRVGIVSRPTIPLALAVAASAASPPMLSPCVIKLPPGAFRQQTGTDLQREPFTTNVMLIDGGIYDNLGLETAWKRYRTILVSDAAGMLEAQDDPAVNWMGQTVRVVDILDGAIRAQRKRQLIDSFKTEERGGTYWGIRNAIEDYLLADALACPRDHIVALAHLPSRLCSLSPLLQEQLINWGYAACDAALRKYVDPTIAKPLGFPYPAAGV